ncbi:hypothetical protein ACFQXA_02425 [Nocardiopsis composta]
MDFRALAERGITLVGRTESFDAGTVRFAADLRDNIARGTPTTWRCWTRPTPTSSATASTCPRSRRPGCWAPTRSR